LGDGAEQRPVVVQRGPLVLAVERGELVALDDDLYVLGASRTDGEPCQSGDEVVENADQSRSASAAFALISGDDRIFRPPHVLAGAGHKPLCGASAGGHVGRSGDVASTFERIWRAHDGMGGAGIQRLMPAIIDAVVFIRMGSRDASRLGAEER
jgi:hypothetical protein